MVKLYILINRALDVTIAPLEGLHPLWPLALWSVVVGVVAMAIYKLFSRQAAIKDAKDKIKAHFLEVWLYIDDAPVIFTAQAKIMWHSLRYLGNALPPLAIMMVLFFPLFANFETRYASGPVPPGKEALVEIKLKKFFDGWDKQVALELLPAASAPATADPCAVCHVAKPLPNPRLAIAAGPIAFIRKTMDPKSAYRELSREYVVDYRLVAQTPGTYDLKVTTPGANFTVPFIVGDKPGLRVPLEQSARLGPALLYPPLAAPPAGSPVESVRIAYPEADFPFLGWNAWWVWPFLIISMVAAYAVKGVFKVEI